MNIKEYQRNAFLKQLAENPLCYICKTNPHAPSDTRCCSCRNVYLKSLRKRNAGKWYKNLTPEKRQKRKARTRIYVAIKRHKMVRQPCCICGAVSEAHHYAGYDDNHLYDVMWLCRKHHREFEKNSNQDLTSPQT